MTSRSQVVASAHGTNKINEGDLSWDFVWTFPEDNDAAKNSKREQYISRLVHVGLDVKKMKATDASTMVLVTAGVDRLKEEAARRGIEMKLKDEFKDKLTGSAGYADFTIEKEHMFAGDNTRRFFTSLERQRLLFDIFEAPKFEHGAELDVDAMVAEKLFTTITPIHDEDDKNRLLSIWAKKFFKAQPLNEVRDYFGEKIAMYFAFLGHYTSWLFILSVFGLIAQIIQIANDDADHPIIPIYCLFLTLWTTFYLESWKRQQAVHAFLWDVQDFEEEEKVRPEYTGQRIRGTWKSGHFISENDLADVEGIADDLEELEYFPSSKRMLRYLFSLPIITTFVVATMAGTTSILALRGLMSLPAPDGMGKTGQIFGGFLNAMFINFMNAVYKKIATKLNNFENHRTDTNYEDALIGKVFMFQFVNSYSSLFYIGFIKQFQIKLFGLESGTCRRSCMDELSTQLFSLVVLMQVVGNVKELMIPYMMGKMKKYLAARKSRKTGVAPDEPIKMTMYEDQSHMAPYPSTFDDYNEMAIQFGFVTMFAAAFPVASLASFVNNVVEIRSDAYKLLAQTQRPRYIGCEDIGSWQKVLEVLSTIAVITNACLVGFTSLVFAGKCEFTANYPHGCDGAECEFFRHDGFRAVATGHSVDLGPHSYDVDCNTTMHAHKSVCCPLVFDNGVNVVREVPSTLFMSSYQVLFVVVVVEHLILLFRAVIAEVIPDTPTWVLKAQARLDLKKQHIEHAADGVRQKEGAEESWSMKEEIITINFVQPTADDFE